MVLIPKTATLQSAFLKSDFMTEKNDTSADQANAKPGQVPPVGRLVFDKPKPNNRGPNIDRPIGGISSAGDG